TLIVELMMDRNDAGEDLFVLSKNLITSAKGYDGKPALSRWAIGTAAGNVAQDASPGGLDDAAVSPFLIINNSYKLERPSRLYDVEFEGSLHVRESFKYHQERRLGWVLGYMAETWCLYAVSGDSEVSYHKSLTAEI